MNQRQSNKLDMYLSVRNVLDENRALWREFRGFSREYNNFFKKTKTLSHLGEVQRTARDGITLGKDNLSALMVESALIVAGALTAFYEAVGDVAASEKYNIEASDLEKLRDQDRDDAALEIHKKAADLIKLEAEAASGTGTPTDLETPQFSDYAVDQAVLDQLEARISAYASVAGSSRATVIKIKDATGAVEKLIEELDRQLDRVFDKLMRPFERSAPEFYRTYRAARVIVDRAATRDTESDAPSENSSGGETAAKVTPVAS